MQALLSLQSMQGAPPLPHCPVERLVTQVELPLRQVVQQLPLMHTPPGQVVETFGAFGVVQLPELLQASAVQGSPSSQVLHAAPPLPQLLTDDPLRQVSPSQQPPQRPPTIHLHWPPTQSRLAGQAPPVLPHTQLPPAQRSTAAPVHFFPHWPQLFESFERLRQACCPEQQSGVAPMHWLAPSSLLLPSQLSSRSLHCSGAPGKTSIRLG